MFNLRIYSKTINYNWENGIQCSTCFEELSSNEKMYSSGRCPHCGTKSPGAVTIVKTKDFAFRRVTYINVFLFLYFIPYFTIRKVRYTRDFTIPRRDLTKKGELLRKLKLNTLKSVINTGVGIFLITGLSGCNNTKDECDNPSLLSQTKLEECAKNNNSSRSGSNYNSSSIVPFFSNNSNTSSSTKSSGFFSGSSTSSSS